ncbi:Acyl-CoA dehydrogenase [Solimonas aquatica]|uniref:Acyl-[acyl-carrier-protein] dehydrogenase MbtN n=1 Tax=Solimonas aquatica TaxID=489703 RepID=A0A1H8ZRG9_9GAMM|nr:acyl-CoA dehydrogenase family protein [Solimonas aquatica]SEP67086.1 Acyl-CoA dehydrogenase [Solimonas aquatica]
MIARTLFKPEHEDFRKTVRRFFETEVLPYREAWEEQQHVDRKLWNKAGELGLLCVTMPEAYGGLGVDRSYSVILMEEQAYSGDSGVGFSLHSDIVAPYINNFGTPEQKQRYLPKLASGEMVGAIAMTEPGTGSDLQAVKTTAVADGDHYILNGSKIFITNGYLCDLAIVVARTGNSGEGAKDISLLLVEADSPGFTKGKPLKKVGMKAQDTCELFFENVRVPKANLLGLKEGMGFIMLMKELAWERLMIAITSVAGGEAVLKHTIEYTRSRKAFGKAVAQFQNTRFKLAEMKAELSIARVFVDRCTELVMQNKLGVDDAATAKYWCSDLLGKVVDQCVQLHGGYGYMLEYPVARAFVDSRAQRIYGGTNEIMKELIARTL